VTAGCQASSHPVPSVTSDGTNFLIVALACSTSGGSALSNWVGLLVAPDGTVAEAEHAVAGALLLSRRPATWLGALIEVPGLHLFAKKGYRLVAANRARISATLGLDACSIESRPT
jgi:hypothetical protein